jgi:hypothetical protein
VRSAHACLQWRLVPWAQGTRLLCTGKPHPLAGGLDLQLIARNVGVAMQGNPLGKRPLEATHGVASDLGRWGASCSRCRKDGRAKGPQAENFASLGLSTTPKEASIDQEPGTRSGHPSWWTRGAVSLPSPHPQGYQGRSVGSSHAHVDSGPGSTSDGFTCFNS